VTETPRLMALGAFLTATGQHPAAWRHPDVDPRAGVSLRHYIDAVRIAERAGFHLMFLADNAGVWDRDLKAEGHSARVSYFEPVTLLSALAAMTERIGLVATATTTFNAPFNVARKFASLDHLSGGRAGWNLVTSANPFEALNFGLDSHPEHAARYALAEEFVDVVTGLWDSWEDGAFVRDKTAGLFYDPSRLHVLNHQGQHFSVRGPLNIERTPQGRPLIVQAGSSGPGIELAARTADVVFTAQHVIEDARAFYRQLKALIPKYGRQPQDVLIMPGISVHVGATRAEAQASFDSLQEMIHPSVGIHYLSSMAGGLDLSGYDPDGPLPDLPETGVAKGRLALLRGIAQRENLSIRQLYMKVVGARGHHTVVGTASDVVDAMEEWFLTDAADGFNVMPPTLPGGLVAFSELVVPELRRRRLFWDGYRHPTLRANLGLPWPACARSAR
jgi:FMN-dependent oxidoreductase (nitrilotriacetate monooxygenase family)